MSGWQGAIEWSAIFQALDKSKIPNVANVPNYLLHENKAGEIDAVAVMAWYSTFVTNTLELPDAPESWADAWSTDYVDNLGWNGQIDSSYLLDIVAHTFFEGRSIMDTREGLDECMAKAVELVPNVKLWYDDEAEFDRQFKGANIIGGQYYNDVAQIMISEGFPARSTFPKEGGVIDFGSWALIKSSDKVEIAHSFIDFCLRPDIQGQITRHLNTAPVVNQAKTDLTDEQFARASTDIPPILPNFEVDEKEQSWLTRRWQEHLLGIA